MEFPRMCPIRWLSDQNFGMCSPHDFLFPFYEMHSNYFRPWKWQNESISKEFSSTIENEKGNYKITLDVQHFRPNEINVKVSNNEIIVEGRHEERPDAHGFITRQFKRRYPLPSQYPPDNVSSSLSSDGILTIIAEKCLTKEVEKIVPIKMCGACPRQTQTETKISSEISQKTQKENIKDTEECMISKNKNQIMLKEDHSRLLRPELLKEAILETNGTCTDKATAKETIEIMKTSVKTDPLNIGSTTSKIEETIGKSILGLTALTEQLGQSSAASTSEMCGKKSMSDNKCEMKAATENLACGMKTPSENICGMKATSENTCGMKSTAEKSDIKGASEMSGLSTSEMSGIKGMSRTVIEESSSSFKSSSSMSSSTKVSGKMGECVSDIISAELREAAENV